MSIHSTVGLVVSVCSMGGGFQGPTGNAISVWDQDDGTRFNILSNRFQ